MRRRILELPAPKDRVFQHSFNVLYIDPEPNLQFRARLVCDNVRTRAATEHSDVARRRSEKTILRPLTPSNLLQNIEQLLNRRLTRLGIRGMRRATLSRNDHTDRTFGSCRQTIVSRLTIDQKLALTRGCVFICRLRAYTAQLFINREKQSNIVHVFPAQSLGCRDLRRNNPLGIARSA